MLLAVLISGGMYGYLFYEGFNGGSVGSSGPPTIVACITLFLYFAGMEASQPFVEEQIAAKYMLLGYKDSMLVLGFLATSVVSVLSYRFCKFLDF